MARALATLPEVSENLRLGKLSYSKARAITRIATPDNEHFLVHIALHGTSGHLERLVRYARKYGPEEAAKRAAQQHQDRFLKVYTDDDGAVVLRGRLPPELGAVVKKALEAAVDSAKAAAREAAEVVAAAGGSGGGEAANDNAAPEERPTDVLGASRADALVDLAESFLASGFREGNAGERYQVIVHVETSAGERSEPASETPAPYIEGVGVIAEETARRLACDASRVIMTERGGETLDVGRRTRTIPPAIRRALTRRDGGCVFPGCACRRFVDAHHVIHWAEGGRTALDNLVLLCRRHHGLVHEGGYTIQLKRGRVTVSDPNGHVVPRFVPLRVPRDGPAAVALANRARGLAITPRTCTPRWGGEAMDYNIALGVLADIRRRAPT